MRDTYSADITASTARCRRCGSESPPGETPPLRGCSEGSAGFDPEHHWLVADDQEGEPA